MAIVALPRISSFEVVQKQTYSNSRSLFRRIKQAAAGFGLAAMCASALADPIIVPPNDLDGTPPNVFCLQITGARHSGSGVEVQFEFLNWNDVPAHDILLTRDPALSTGGTFGGSSVNAGPVGNKYNKTNDWHVDSSGPNTVRFVAGTPLAPIDLYIGRNGDPRKTGLEGVDPVTGNGRWLTAAELPSPVDSGINALDGFRLVLPNLDPGERVVFNWAFSDGTGQAIPRISSNGGFNQGIFQIDRADDGPAGEIRFASFLNIGSNSSSIENAPPVDLAATNANAKTIPLIAEVPEPALAELLMAGLLVTGLVGWRRRDKR